MSDKVSRSFSRVDEPLFVLSGHRSTSFFHGEWKLRTMHWADKHCSSIRSARLCRFWVKMNTLTQHPGEEAAPVRPPHERARANRFSMTSMCRVQLKPSSLTGCRFVRGKVYLSADMGQRFALRLLTVRCVCFAIADQTSWQCFVFVFPSLPQGRVCQLSGRSDIFG